MAKILVFGHLGDIVGKEILEITACADGVGGLRKKLAQDYPALRGASFQVSVNRQIAADDFPINENDEVALLPPFAGG